MSVRGKRTRFGVRDILPGTVYRTRKGTGRILGPCRAAERRAAFWIEIDGRTRIVTPADIHGVALAAMIGETRITVKHSPGESRVPTSPRSARLNGPAAS